MVEQARGRIQILPGGGIRAHNAREISDATGCRQVHLSAFGAKSDHSTAARPEISFLSDHHAAHEYARTDPAKVREVARALAGESQPSSEPRG